jgi:hypothetical protein
VGALSVYLEAEGIATTQISLVREHSAAIRPPRVLWVPFPLGRPLGAPSDAAFQRRVMLGALALLERASGPILEDFPDDAPASRAPDHEGWVCPVSFSAAAAGDNKLGLQREITQLAPWHDLALRKSGRPAAGLSGLDVRQAAEVIGRQVETGVYAAYRNDLAPGLALRLACEDLKSYYFDALSAQPGNASAGEMQHWFWKKSAAGKALLALRDVCVKSEDRSLRLFARRNLVPRAISNDPGSD